MKQLFASLFIFLLGYTPVGLGQAQLIFDTDLGGDVDDLGALAMLHHFVDKGEWRGFQ